MFPLTLSLMILLCAPQSGAEAPAKDTGVHASSKGKEPASQPSQADPWAALKKRIAERLKGDRKRLEKAIQPYLSDLVLDASDPKNRSYLQGRYQEIAGLDPDIALVLLPYLSPKSNNRRSRLLANNSMQVLALTDLEPLEPDLQKIVEKDRGLARNRALWLLTGFMKTGLDKTLQKLLAETPEVLLPGVIEAVGRYGQSSLARPLHPFLKRPDEKQRSAAFEALCRIGSAESLAPLVASAKISNKAADRTRLIQFLRTLGQRPGTDGWRKDEASFFEHLTWLLNQGEALRRQEIQDLLRLLRSLPAETGKARGGATLVQVLDRLLANPYPDIQFEAALALRHLGDNKGVKKVLDRLTRFVKSNRKLSYAYRQRGRAYEAFGEISDAMRDYKQAVSLSAGRVDPRLYLALARLEAKKGNASNVLRYLKEAEPTRQELLRFRARTPEVEALIRRSNQLRRLFEKN